jgi:hypothetical protein
VVTVVAARTQLQPALEITLVVSVTPASFARARPLTTAPVIVIAVRATTFPVMLPVSVAELPT